MNWTRYFAPSILFCLAVNAPAQDVSVTTAGAGALAPVPTSGPYSWTYGPFEYDPTGNVAVIGGNYFVYDPMGRLVTSSIQRTDQPGSQSQTYTYDPYGNRLSVNGTSYSANASTNRLTSNGAAYDVAGNLTQWQPPGSAYARQYTYDALSMMTREVNGAYSAIDIYTPDDQRLWVLDTLPSGGNVSHWTVRDLGGNVLRDFIDDGTPWRLHREYFYRDDALLAVDTAIGTEHYSLDHLGTPRLVTNGQGYKIFHHHYFPFGEEWTIGGDPVDAATMRFTGHERDDDLRGEPAGTLDYMRARYYSAMIGRFLSVDRVLGSPRTPQSWNRYSYVRNSPMNFIDPFGLFTCNSNGCFDELTVTAEDPLRQAKNAAEQDSALREAQFLADLHSLWDQAMNIRSPVTGLTTRESWRASGYGFVAFIDGVIPFGDPLEDVYNDGSVDGVEYSKKVGEYTRDVEIAIAAGGAGAATMETRGGAEAGNWVTNNLFRCGKGAWKETNGVKRWHFHFGPGKAMRHHLPSQSRTWRYHATAIIRAWLQGKR